MSAVTASDGVPLYVEVHGEGDVVLFSPGFCQTHENFRAQVAPLCLAGARVVLWDYRGHGRSGAPDDPAAYSMSQVVDDLGRVLEHAAGDRPAVLAGLSFGGLASLHYTLANPDRVRGLALLASGPGFKNPESQARWEAQVGRVADRLVERGFEGYTDGRAAATAIGRQPELPAARAAGRAIVAQNAHAVAEFGRRVAGPAPCVIDELAGIEVPALVLVGEQDEAYLRAGEVMATRLPRAKHLRVADAGHVLNIEQADVVNRHLIDFLASLPLEGAPRGSD